MERFSALRVHQEGDKTAARIEQICLDDLGPGEVVIRAAYSSVNYKDALAGTGRGKIMRRFPMVGGVDVCGRVVESSDQRYKQDEHVLVTGFGMSQDHDGGYAEYVRVPADWVVPLPAGLSLFEAMAIGTGGFTAALAVQRMEVNGQAPERGPIVVTGATGGVGSFAVDILSARGYSVTAITGRPEEQGYLSELGAAEVLLHQELEKGGRPLEKGMWGGAVDNVGGELLAWLTRTVKPWGCIASVGLAGGHDLNTTVMPFIIRGVSLLGIDSAGCEMGMRRTVWDRLGSDLKPAHLGSIAPHTVGLEDLPRVFQQLLSRELRGRTVVRLAGEAC